MTWGGATRALEDINGRLKQLQGYHDGNPLVCWLDLDEEDGHMR